MHSNRLVLFDATTLVKTIVFCMFYLIVRTLFRHSKSAKNICDTRSASQINLPPNVLHLFMDVLTWWRSIGKEMKKCIVVVHKTACSQKSIRWSGKTKEMNGFMLFRNNFSRGFQEERDWWVLCCSPGPLYPQQIVYIYFIYPGIVVVKRTRERYQREHKNSLAIPNNDDSSVCLSLEYGLYNISSMLPT